MTELIELIKTMAKIARPLLGPGSLWGFDEAMNRLEGAIRFHPRAAKLMAKRKGFLVVACDEPYYCGVYSVIREHEIKNGRWTLEDEKIFSEVWDRFHA